MALSDKEISALYFEALGSQHLREQDRKMVTRFAHAVEAEVRRQDDALIQQMHDALCECAEDSQEQLDRMEAAKLRQYKPQAVAYQEATIDAAKRAIAAARARLEGRP